MKILWYLFHEQRSSIFHPENIRCGHGNTGHGRFVLAIKTEIQEIVPSEYLYSEGTISYISVLIGKKKSMTRVLVVAYTY